MAQSQEERYVIDVNHLSEQDLRLNYPKTYQWLMENVKPVRDINNDSRLRREWWRYRRTNAIMRDGVEDLDGYILTPRTAKHRCFTLRPKNVFPESEVIVIFLDDPYYLGVLSSKIHVDWALAAGGDLGGNTPRYNNTVCFDPFPFPDSTPDRQQQIRELGDRLDSHRKRVQAQHPDVTITAMYNLLEKIRAGQELSESDRAFNNKALVSTLKQIHDELDAAVFEAYGWSDLIGRSPLTPLTKGGTEANPSEVPLFKGNLGGSQPQNVDELILERLVALNAERAEEERNGLIRWLRPDYQAPGEVQTQQVIEGIAEVEVESAITPVEQQKLPKAFKDQLAAVRDLLRTQSGEWTIEQIAAQFKSASRQKQTILTCLESLEALGIIAKHSEDSSDRWYLAELQQAS